MVTIESLALQELIPIRFLACPDNGLAISEIKKSLNPFFYQPPSNNEWLQALQQLAERGLLNQTGKSRFQISAAGQKLALQKLGLQSLPPATRWLTLKNCYLIASLLKLPAPINERDRRSITSADGLRASILVNAFRLPAGSYPSLTKARDSLLWQQLAEPVATTNLQHKLAASNATRSRPFTMGSVIALLLNSLLGTERELPWDAALKQLAAKAVSARRISPEELRLAILRTATEKPSQLPEPFPDPQPEPFNLEFFANQVMQSAKRSQTGKFGDNKVFISHVWHQMELDGNTFGLDLKQFKHHLALANNKNLINLSRADLAYAMDQNAVSASETSYLNSIFHFIRLEP
ncbi:hypothetical protein [Nitrosomonas halophila]|uniref:Uncharacterized protein n=1 Tax=Nitrosomonas halophila TaxID=44576 RepID=A0A1H3NRT2_9PROT|nr:hypothetical protein [Nitrosomonas halophila]SDY91636.1 hypothetical protein SAMN05421881_10799 [Nitrosomonas halophila]